MKTISETTAATAGTFYPLRMLGLGGMGAVRLELQLSATSFRNPAWEQS